MTAVGTKIVLDRVVKVDGSVDATMSAQRDRLAQLAKEDKSAPITLVITSFGGNVFGMFALMDRITHLRRAGVQINGLVEGYAMSAGLILLQACDKRMMGPNAVLMAHGISAGIQEDLEGFDNEIGQIKDMTRRVAALFAKRTGQTPTSWSRLFRSAKPRYFNAQQALDAHLVDEILDA